MCQELSRYERVHTVRDGPTYHLSVGSQPTLDILVNLRVDLRKVLQLDVTDLVTLNDASPIGRCEAVCGWYSVYLSDGV